jgi:WD40 repeat protein
MVTTSRDSTARVWDTKTGDEISVFNGHTDIVHSAEFDPGDRLIATASEDRTVRLWEATTGKPVNIYRDHFEEVHLAKFSPSGQQLLTASYDNTARIFEVKPFDTDQLINKANEIMTILGY